ncbi:carbohydrate ABC transporter permease [Kosmotoga pacifica]|uniref:Sugar ABC transporter permease n=1 Tax=Kosmotoga pacifica TaxID=1330330 RepID=A0A0G2Z8Z4_9BACT|nr:sugar ABC transporter permease [Kosmotoga pacifica]AKI98070.1 sugar ABC transporter permease [Kosmotoga pacifica]
MAYTKYSRRYWRETLQAYLFLLPSIVILGIFVFWPIGFSLVLSFFKWDYTSAEKYFIGLENYKELFRMSYPIDLNLFYALLNTVVYLFGAMLFVRLVYFISSSLTKYSKPDKKFLLPYSSLIVLFILFYITKSVKPGLSIAWLTLSVAFIGYFLFVLKKFKSDNHITMMRLRSWTTLVLSILTYIALAFWLTHPGDELISYFRLAKESSDFLKAIYNTVYYVILSVPTQIGLALVIALLLNRNIKFKNLFRTAYFIPFVTSVVAVSLVWQWMFNDQFGLLNYFLSWFEINKIAWLKEEHWTIPTIAIVSVWQHLGYTTVIFLAGLQNIDRSYYEAANVDGANAWQKFKYITWPLLSPTTFFIMIITMIGSFKIFSQIFILYQGLPGPVNKSGLTLVYYVFQKFYDEQRMGVASAAAYMLFLIILLLTFIQFRIGKKRVHYEN